MKNLEKWKLNAILISCTKDKKKQLKGVEQVSTAQNMEFSIKDFFSKCDQICSFLRIWSHLLKKSFMENFIFCAVTTRGRSESPFIPLWIKWNMCSHLGNK